MTDTQPRTFDRNRLRLGIVLAVIAGAIAFLLIQGLGNATTYFKNADEAVASRQSLGTKRFRLQGTVVAGSVHETGNATAFAVEYHCKTVSVLNEGSPPQLFKPGIPVVLEGAFARDSDVFHSNRILVRHTSEYRTKESQRLDAANKEAC